MKENNGLMVFKETIAWKIKKFFRNIFGKNKNNSNARVNENSSNLAIEDVNPYTINIEELDEDICSLSSGFESLKEEIEYRQQRMDLLKIYENIKSGKCQLKNLMMDDLIKVMLLFKEEQKTIKRIE